MPVVDALGKGYSRDRRQGICLSCWQHTNGRRLQLSAVNMNATWGMSALQPVMRAKRTSPYLLAPPTLLAAPSMCQKSRTRQASKNRGIRLAKVRHGFAREKEGTIANIGRSGLSRFPFRRSPQRENRTGSNQI